MPSLALTVLLTAACSSPTKPTPAETPLAAAAPDLADTVWTGYVRITSCTSASGCESFVNGMYAFTLRIENTGGGWAAQLESTTPDAYRATLSGRLEPDGTFVFSGGSPDGRVNVQQLTLRKDAVTGLRGAMHYSAGPPPGYQDETRTFDAIIPSAVAGRDLSQPGPGASLEMAGTWAGTARVDTCAGAICSQHLSSDPHPFSITVKQTGGGFSALLVSNIVFTTVAHLTGTPQPDGTVTFSGHSDSDGGPLGGDFPFFTLRVDPSLGLSGKFQFIWEAPVGNTTFNGTILSASRAASFGVVQPFQGYWSGDYVPQSCVGDCALHELNRHTPQSFQLVLSQAGASVQGDALGVPVTGTAAGNALSLQGERIVEPCLWDWEGRMCTQRLTKFSASLDEFGELHGSLEYFEEGWAGQLHYRYTVTADLANVVRQVQ
jgi:hypothetical protein